MTSETRSEPLSRRKTLAAIAALIASTALAGMPAAVHAQTGKRPVVGVTLRSLEFPAVVLQADALKAAAAAKGIDLVLLDPRGSTATEFSQIEGLVNRKVDLIIMFPCDQKISQNAARLVNAAGIPLLLMGGKLVDEFVTSGGTYKAYVGSDDIDIGRVMGKYFADQFPQGGSAIFLIGRHGSAPTERRKAGFYEVIKPRPDLKVVTELQAFGSRAEAKSIMENLLQRYKPGQVQALVAGSDEMAIGASSAIEAAGRLGEFKVLIGVDGLKPGLDAVREGRLTATVLQDFVTMGQTAIGMTSDILAKKPVASKDIPSILITKDNVARF